MRGQNTFSPAQLRSELLPLDLNGPPQPAPSELGNYLRFFDLNLSQDNSGLSHRVGYLTSGQYQIALQLFEPVAPRGTAVVCHGYYDHVGLYGHLIRYLLTHKLTVVAFDLPGHGLSSGQPATIEDFGSYGQALESCLTAVHGLVPEPWHILGQSLGGSVVLEYLARAERDRGAEHRKFNEIVLFAPLVRPALWPINRVFFEILKRTVDERPRTFTNNAENSEFLALVRLDPMQATVLPVQWVSALITWMNRFEKYRRLPDNMKIIQGHTDRTVGWRYNLKLLDRMCEPQVLHLPTARHHLVNEAEPLRRQMWQWLDECCKWG
ncbi:MAG: alpha/beta hydrolase [Gammaproteobacteria bacterium]|nr:alpha/beta hydrolase [Gammaproteobacteria bacterium]